MLASADVSTPQYRFVLNADGGKLADSFQPKSSNVLTPANPKYPYILVADQDKHLEVNLAKGLISPLVGSQWFLAGNHSKPCQNIYITPWKPDECTSFAHRILTDRELWCEIHAMQELYLEKDKDAVLVLRRDYNDSYIYSVGSSISRIFEQIRSGSFDEKIMGKPLYLAAPLAHKIKILNPTELKHVVKGIELMYEHSQIIIATCNSTSEQDKTISVDHRATPIDLDRFIPFETHWPDILDSPKSEETDAVDELSDSIDKMNFLDADSKVLQDTPMHDQPLADPTGDPRLIQSPVASTTAMVIKCQFVKSGGTFSMSNTQVLSPSPIHRLYKMSNQDQNNVAKELKSGLIRQVIHTHWHMYAQGEYINNYRLFPITSPIALVTSILDDKRLDSEIDQKNGCILDRDPSAIMWIKRANGMHIKVNAKTAKSLLRQSSVRGDLMCKLGKLVLLQLPNLNLMYVLSHISFEELCELNVKSFPGSTIVCSKYQRTNDLTLGATKFHPTKLLNLSHLLKDKLNASYFAQVVKNSQAMILYNLFEQNVGPMHRGLMIGPNTKPQANYDFEHVVYEIIHRMRSDQAVFSDDKKLYIDIHDQRYHIADLLDQIHWESLGNQSSKTPPGYDEFLAKCIYKPLTESDEPVTKLEDLSTDHKFSILNFAEVAAINLYTHDRLSYDPPPFKVFNAWLRGQYNTPYTHSKDPNQVAQALVHLFFLASGLNKLPRAETSMLYRGESNSRSLSLHQRFAASHVMEPFEEKGFVSATTSFNKIPHAVLGVDRGYLCITEHDAKNISGLSKFPREKEALSLPSIARYYPSFEDGERYYIGRNVRSLCPHFEAKRDSQGTGYVKPGCIEPCLAQLKELIPLHDDAQPPSYLHSIARSMKKSLSKMLEQSESENVLIPLFMDTLDRYRNFLATFRDLSISDLQLSDEIDAIFAYYLNKHPIVTRFSVATLIDHATAASDMHTFITHMNIMLIRAINLKEYRYFIPNDSDGYFTKDELTDCLKKIENIQLGQIDAIEGLPAGWIRDKVTELAPERIQRTSRASTRLP